MTVGRSFITRKHGVKVRLAVFIHVAPVGNTCTHCGGGGGGGG